MALALDAQVLLSILAHESSSEDISRTLRATPASYSMSLAYGTGDNQAQVVWSDSATATTTPATYNLLAMPGTSGGVSTSTQFSEIKLLYIRNKSGGITMTVQTAGYAQLPSQFWVRAQGVALFTTPVSLGFTGSGFTQTLTIAANSSTVDYDIIIIGEGGVT